MSGGMFSYMYSKDFDQLTIDDFEGMEIALGESKYAANVLAATELAGKEFRDLLGKIEVFHASLENLRPVWKALEWWWSCDTGEDSFREACVKFDASQK